jgi:hypothetical protein
VEFDRELVDIDLRTTERENMLYATVPIQPLAPRRRRTS